MVGASTNVTYGSDIIADSIRQLGIEYVALNPGASFRGLHDSLVNHLGNVDPRMILCLHEEHAVAIAHGYAKIAGKPMAAVLHSNVGLMHGAMAIFNAWCDRVPVLVIGATGPVDAARRRPWIDWIHTCADQGGLIRNFVKWDNQPGSAQAAREALFRACQLARTAPAGPVYVNIDAAIQETIVTDRVDPVEVARFAPPPPSWPDPDQIERAVGLLKAARRPLILAGRVSRDQNHWQRRVELAGRLQASVLTDLKTAAAFPTCHPSHIAPPGLFPQPAALEALREADVILSLDWIDLAGTLSTAFGGPWPRVSVIQASLDQLVHNGWSMDHQGLPAVDINMLNDPDVVVAALTAVLGDRGASRPAQQRDVAPASERPTEGAELDVRSLGIALREACGERDVCLTRLPLSWPGDIWPFRHPLDYLGYDGGGGIGSGPGMAVGAALALKGSKRLAVAVLGDGDLAMGMSAIWTAAHYRIPLLIVVANNRSYFNDEVHQDRVAKTRNRPVENRWIGQRISDPDLDFAKLAEGQGAIGIGPITTATELQTTLREAISAVENGAVVVVDVRVAPSYDTAIQAAISR